jgi:replicative DNA helicase
MAYEEDVDLSQYIHTPQRSSSGYVKLATELTEGRGVKFGFNIDDNIIPARAGKVFDIIARPGHGKTSLMLAMAKNEAYEVMRRGEEEDTYVGYVTWETPVEELDAFLQNMPGYSVTDLAWGRVPVDEIKRNSIKRVNLPIWLFGMSLYGSSFRSPPFTIERLYDAIEHIYDKYGKKPSALFLDYIQRIPVPNERERYMQVTAATHMVRKLSVEAKTPIFLGVQANQRIDDRSSPIPSMRDAEWSAAITQDADTVVGLWRPIRTHDQTEHAHIKVGDEYYDNTERLMVIKLLKQRWERGTGIFAADMDMATLGISTATPSVRGQGISSNMF